MSLNKKGLGIALAAVLILALAGWLGFRFSGQGDEVPFAGPEVALIASAWPDGPDAVTFAVIGDFGTGRRDQFRVAARMAQAYQEQPYEHLLTVGDNVYGGTVADRAAEVIDRPYRPLFVAGVSFRPSLGNHDVEDPDDLPLTLATLGMPRRYYQFSDGPVDFFALDSNRMDGDQLTWLEKGLSCSDRRWQVAYLHHPIYSSGKHGSDRDLREVLEPVLVRGGADVLLAGHDHNYERTTPQEGIVHIVTGGGAKLRGVGARDFTVVSKSKCTSWWSRWWTIAWESARSTSTEPSSIRSQSNPGRDSLPATETSSG